MQLGFWLANLYRRLQSPMVPTRNRRRRRNLFSTAANTEVLEVRRTLSGVPAAVGSVLQSGATGSINHAPVGTSNTVTTGENVAYPLKTSDFGFTDPGDNPPNSLQAVKFTTLPNAGTLKDNGAALTVNQFVSAADIGSGKLVFIPNANLLGGPFFLCRFQVQDNGGTANGGVNLDPIAKVLDVKIVKVNHAPSGTSKTVTTDENVAYTLKSVDFGFTDPNDSPPNTLLAVKFTLLPTAGTLKDNGTAVTVNQFVSAVDISGGKLVFTPNTNLAGGPFFLCKFQVQDNGGTANGGVNLDPTAKVLDILVRGAVGGPELQVNTYTTGRQLRPDIATDAAGDFVTVWWSDGEDGSGTGIFARRYNAAGTALGVEFQVNTYTTGNQLNPVVAMDSNGDFVIAWQSDQSGGGVYAQRYSAGGVAQGIEFRVNSSANNGQHDPSAAMDSSGGFVIAWDSVGQDGSGDGVYAHRYSAAGAAEGGEFLVNSYTTGTQQSPSVAMSGSGDFVIAWDGLGPSGKTNNDVYLQRYNSSGAAVGGQFSISASTTVDQESPKVAMDASGDFVVTWFNANQDGGGEGIFAQRFSAAGSSEGGVFRVNTYTTNNQSQPSVAMDAAGDFVITWRSDNQHGYGYGIYAQRYAASGVPNGAEFQISTHTTPGQSSPHVAFDAQRGEFVVAWASYGQDGSNYGIYARRFVVS